MPIGNDGRSYATQDAADAANARVTSGASPAAAPSPAPSVTANAANSQKPSPQSTSGINQTSTANPTTQTPTATPPAQPAAGQVVNGYQEGTGTNDEVNANGTSGPGAGSTGFNNPAQTKPAAPSTAPAQGTPDSTATAANAGSTNNASVTEPHDQAAADPLAAGEAVQTQAEQQFEAANGKLADSLTATVAANIGDLQQNLADDNARYDQMDQSLQDMNASRIAAINTATTASQAAADAAQAASQAALDIQRKQTLQSYQNLQIAQAVQNKQKQIGAETELGMLGGNFTTAGVADIQDTILAGEHAMVGIQQNQDIAMQGLTSEGVNIQNDYRDQTLKIEQFASDSINTAYQDLQNGIMQVMEDKNKTEDQITTAINGLRDNYNTNISKINSDTLAARVTLGNSMVSNSQFLTNLATTKQTQARSALVTLSSTIDLSNLTPLQTTALNTLETQAYGEGAAGLIQGSNIKFATLQEKTTYNTMSVAAKLEIQKLKDNYARVNWTADASGNVTAIAYDANGIPQTFNLGKIGAPPTQFTSQINQQTGQQDITNTRTGAATVAGQGGSTTPSDPTTLGMPATGSQGGPCGHFVNTEAGMSMGDTLASKMAQVNAAPLPGPVAGAVFVMAITAADMKPGTSPADAAKLESEGHTGIVLGVNADGTVKVYDSNWTGPGQVGIHNLSASQISGYTAPKGGPALQMYQQGGQSNTNNKVPGVTGAIPAAGQEPAGYFTNKVSGTTMTQAEIDSNAKQLLNSPVGTRSAMISQLPAGADKNAVMAQLAALPGGMDLTQTKIDVGAMQKSVDDAQTYISGVGSALQAADTQWQGVQQRFTGMGINMNDSTLANQTMNDISKTLGSAGDLRAYQSDLNDLANEYSQVFAKGGATTDTTRSTASDIANGNITLDALGKTMTELQTMGKQNIASRQSTLDNLNLQIKAAGSGGTKTAPNPNASFSPVVNSVLGMFGIQAAAPTGATSSILSQYGITQ